MLNSCGNSEPETPLHAYADSPVRHGTAEEVLVYRSRRMRAIQESGHLQVSRYAVTEMMTLTFRSLCIDLAARDFCSPSRDEKIGAFHSTAEGVAFADLIRTILETGFASRLLWGQVAEETSKMVILLDWPEHSARKSLYVSGAFIAARTAIQQVLTRDIEVRAFNIQDASTRNECFGRSASENAGTVPLDTAFYMWHFPTGIRDLEIVVHDGDDGYDMLERPESESGNESDPSSTQEEGAAEDGEIVVPPHVERVMEDATNRDLSGTFETHWEHFALQYHRRCAPRPPPFKMPPTPYFLRSTQHPPWGGSWEVPVPVPVPALVPMTESVSAQSVINEGDGHGDTFLGVIGTYRDFHRSYLRRKLDSDCSYADGGIGELKSIALDGLEVFHVELHCLRGWQGSLLPPSEP